MESKRQNLTGLLHRINSHPLFGISGWVVGIISFIIIFLPSEQRELTYAVNPVTTSIVKVGESSVLKIDHAGKVITNNINAVQIAIWNAGKLPIKRDEILEPVRLIVTNAQILEATARKISRSATGLKLGASRLESGVIDIEWNILEHGDGLSVQVIYSGQQAAVDCRGVILGQPNVRELEINVEQGPSVKRKTTSTQRAVEIAGLLPVGVLLYLIIMGKTGKRWWEIALMALMCTFAFVSIWFSHSGISSPPFGF